uniref:Deoxynucleoside monophosphate kinase n=1 Tax=virus sp. ctrcb4 TaxID=2825824 RepID=A0A8S5RQ63_9VIRU|nr:MAG TPA: deoxynucleoside monophosphate kinase [virus sp. ctrcb4]
MITDKQLSRMIKSKKLNVISNYYISIRQLLQIFGTEIIREYFGNNF